MKRKKFISLSAMTATGMLISKGSMAGGKKDFPIVRVAENMRKFKSPALEKLIAEVKKNTGNKELGWLFENCFPNTLDTTVDFEIINNKPDTFVITGDIDAMWLRDSSAQVWPYLALMKEDKNLQELIKGVINRQTKFILKDPYANAFYKDENKVSEWKDDKTLMKPGVHERKWEIDSLCYPIRLAQGYLKETGDTSPFDKDWIEAMRLVVQTFKEQQRLDGKGPYKFERTTSWATDGVPLGGYGYPAKTTGMIHAMFRPSDDATIYPFNIPGNMLAYLSLARLAAILKKMPGGNEKLMGEAGKLGEIILTAVNQYGTIMHPVFKKIFAYEVNGFGSFNLMDDANVPSLLSLSYLGIIDPTKENIYRNTRRYVLSNENPFFFKGKAGEGIGGPHVGMDYIWPMSIIMRALTSHDDKEIKNCLTTLQSTHAGTGFMHESFHKDDASKFTRKWFAWANTLFGELLWKTYRERKYLLD
ncbi:MAG TPA: glycoside hydrolase family 125 protein [Chitinophagaceae bacterium]|nr:glycoside hydrolase family 125 protein [Chitinophagaceae bacterium]